MQLASVPLDRSVLLSAAETLRYCVVVAGRVGVFMFALLGVAVTCLGRSVNMPRSQC